MTEKTKFSERAAALTGVSAEQMARAVRQLERVTARPSSPRPRYDVVGPFDLSPSQLQRFRVSNDKTFGR